MNEKTNIALNKFAHLLESKYGLTITDTTMDHLRFVHEYYNNQKKTFPTSDVRYKKAYLISEVARLMILREIQPRPGKNKKRRGS